MPWYQVLGWGIERLGSVQTLATRSKSKYIKHRALKTWDDSPSDWEGTQYACLLESFTQLFILCHIMIHSFTMTVFLLCQIEFEYF